MPVKHFTTNLNFLFGKNYNFYNFTKGESISKGHILYGILNDLI